MDHCLGHRFQRAVGHRPSSGQIDNSSDPTHSFVLKLLTTNRERSSERRGRLFPPTLNLARTGLDQVKARFIQNPGNHRPPGMS
jgi:hypothetical protein